MLRSLGRLHAGLAGCLLLGEVKVFGMSSSGVTLLVLAWYTCPMYPIYPMLLIQPIYHGKTPGRTNLVTRRLRRQTQLG